MIRQAEGFLKGRPRSPHHLDVLLVLAQAYETWWSISQASPEDEYVESTRYQSGSAGAREKAIETYRQLQDLAKESPTASYAARRVARLKLGIDTNQRRFYCIYD